ncbi:MAG TPA: DUF1501 domain-containing protein [Phycisphaerales bacterium]|jgi:uncharacterized protein (DUF1501 family)|nr:DUF1501 domain-containing protein [Phycisphaerales bacterium]
MHLTRRYFLKSTGAVVTYLGVAPLLPSVARAMTPRPVAKNKTLVVLFLRGGADGLNLVTPYGDPHYANLRRGIGTPAPDAGNPNSLIDLDGFFGLNPRMAALKPFFDSGLCAAAHAVGYDKNTRSHFEEQDTWETGVAGNTIHSDGWLNRHLLTSTGRGPIRAVSIGDSLPRIMQGKAPAYAVRGLDELNLPKTARGLDPEAVASALEHAYQGEAMRAKGAATDLLAQSASTTLDGVRQLRAVTSGPYKPTDGVEYPKTDLARKLAQIARLIKADVGLEVAEVDLGGFDTHQNQGRGGEGQLGNLAQQMADATSAFAKDLGDRMDDVLVVTLSDFGRTAFENGTGGTDHGWASCMFLLGGAVQRASKSGGTGLALETSAPVKGSRKVLTKWPGLAPDQLHEKRDLLHTTDFRDVLGEIVSVHLGNENVKTVLPNHDFKQLGLIA